MNETKCSLLARGRFFYFYVYSVVFVLGYVAARGRCDVGLWGDVGGDRLATKR